MMRYILTIVALALCVSVSSGQGQLFGFKGGLTLGTQKWNSFERDPLFASHFAVSVESAEQDRESALYAQLGYHTKGSAVRFQRFFDINGNEFNPANRSFKFNNAALQVGVKQIIGEASADSRLFYKIGIRGEFTVSTNLDEFDDFSLSFPKEDFVQDITYGISFGAGYEYYISDLIRGFVELNIGQDLSNQYFQPPIANVPSPFNQGQLINLPERKIVNTTVELSVGILLWRKVEYIN